MTFDFTPGWLDISVEPAEVGAARTAAAAIPAAPFARALAAPCPPPHPTMAQMAELVEELFTEGSMSFHQLCSLSNVPELEPLLGDAVSGVAPARRVADALRR